MLMERNDRSATSWLLSPEVISAMISDSRTVRPCLRPGQSPSPETTLESASSVTTTSPSLMRSRALTSSAVLSRLSRWALAPLAKFPGCRRFDDLDSVEEGLQHPVETVHHHLVVVDDRDPYRPRGVHEMTGPLLVFPLRTSTISWATSRSLRLPCDEARTRKANAPSSSIW